MISQGDYKTVLGFVVFSLDVNDMVSQGNYKLLLRIILLTRAVNDMISHGNYKQRELQEGITRRKYDNIFPLGGVTSVE